MSASAGNPQFQLPSAGRAARDKSCWWAPAARARCRWRWACPMPLRLVHGPRGSSPCLLSRRRGNGRSSRDDAPAGEVDRSVAGIRFRGQHLGCLCRRGRGLGLRARTGFSWASGVGSGSGSGSGGVSTSAAAEVVSRCRRARQPILQPLRTVAARSSKVERPRAARGAVHDQRAGECRRERDAEHEAMLARARAEDERAGVSGAARRGRPAGRRLSVEFAALTTTLRHGLALGDRGALTRAAPLRTRSWRPLRA